MQLQCNNNPESQNQGDRTVTPCPHIGTYRKGAFSDVRLSVSLSVASRETVHAWRYQARVATGPMTPWSHEYQ